MSANGRYPRVITVAAFLVAVAAGLYTTLLIYRPVVQPMLAVAPPFLIAIVLALLLDPLLDVLERKGISRGWGVATVGVTLIVALLLVGFLLIPQMVRQASMLADNLPRHLEQTQKTIDSIMQHNRALLHRLHLPTTIGEFAERYSGQLETVASGALTFLVNSLTAVLSRFLWFIIIPMATLWLLRDIDHIKAKIVHFTPERHRQSVIQLGTAIGVVFGKYVRGMLTVAILFSLLAMLVLQLFGLNYALLIGAISGLFYLVPYIGVLIMALITGAIAIVQPGVSVSYAVLLMGILMFQSYVIFDLIITPRVVGGSVGVHPVLMLFALALGAQIAGVVGMVLAVPVAASLQVAIGQFCPKIYDKVAPMRSYREKRPPPHEPESA